MKRWVLCPNALACWKSGHLVDFKDIWIKKWVFSSMDTNDQRGEILLGNQTGNGLLTRE